MKKDTKEVIDLVEKYTDKLAKITDGYKTVVGKIDKIRETLEAHKTKWGYVYRMPIIFAIIVVILIFADTYIKWETINLFGIIEIIHK